MMIFDIPLPWDVLHRATVEYLPGYAPGFVDFEPPAVDPIGWSTFTLTQAELGVIGELSLRKVSARITQMIIKNVPGSFQDDRAEHLDKVIRAFLNRLLHDLAIWVFNQIPPKYLVAMAGMGEWPDLSVMSQEGQNEYAEFHFVVEGRDVSGTLTTAGTITFDDPSMESRFFSREDPAEEPRKPAIPAKPERLKPGKNSPDLRQWQFQWFDYYHAMRASGRKYTLGQLAKEMNYTEGTLKGYHAYYRAEKKISN